MKVKTILFMSSAVLIGCGGFLAPVDYPDIGPELFSTAFLVGLVLLVIALTPRTTFMMGSTAFRMVYGCGLFGAVLQAAYAEASNPTTVASLIGHMLFNVVVVTAIIHFGVWASAPKR